MGNSTEKYRVGFALRTSLEKGYDFQSFKKDLIAGLIVSLVALPLAMALSIAVGLPPQHGLYTAIVAGIVTPLLGGSIYQVSGPTAAFAVIIAPIVSEYGLRGLIIATILAGIIIIVSGLAKLGQYINYIPYPVTTGFTSGIAVVIGTLALNDFLGLHIENLQGSFLQKFMSILGHFPSLHWPEALIGTLSLFLMFTSTVLIRKIPSPVVGIGIGTIVAYLFQSYGVEIATIGNHFHYTLPNGDIAQGIPPFLPSFQIPGISTSELFSLPSFNEIKILAVPALVIAVLAALESLLSAAVSDGMSGTKHNPNAELVGIGIGNILSGLASGIPASGAIARTATNIQNGGRTPLSSCLHAVLIMLYVLLFAPYLSYIPMASLAALLLITAYHMSHWKQFLRVIKISPLDDTIVLGACFSFTVLIDMVAGVTVGIVLACFLLVKRISAITELQVSHITKSSHTKIKHVQLPHDAIIYHINGSLFFGTVEKITEQIEMVDAQIRTFIIDLEDVPFIDMTGIIAIKRMILDLKSNDKNIIIFGKRKIIGQVHNMLSLDSIGSDIKFVETLDQAVGIATGMASEVS